MREYELMCVMVPDLDEAGVEAQHERVRSLITGRGGEVISVEPWGRRRLAYQIGNHREGLYSVTRFRLQAGETDTLDRGLRLNESVIRHLIVQPESV